MENQTGYDLSAAIENWRQELAAQAGLSADERRELETHLRDAIVGFQQRGLNNEESFWLARRRVGQPQQLGEEFLKADPAKVWRERVFWMVLAFFLIVTLGSIPNTVSAFIADDGQPEGIPFFLLYFLLFVIFNWVPLIVVILLGAGKMTRQFSKASDLISGRYRAALVVFVLVFMSLVLNYFAVPHMNAMMAKAGSHELPAPSIAFGFGEVLVPLVPALLLIWLFPSGNPKRLQRT